MSPPRPSDDLAALDERGQSLLHRARGLRGLTPHQVDRIARRLKERRPARRGGVLLRAFAAIALVLLAGTAAAWASGALTRLPWLRALFAGGRAAPTAAAPSTNLVAPVSPGQGPIAPVDRLLLPASEPPREGSDEQRPPVAERPGPDHSGAQSSVRRRAPGHHRPSVAAANLERTSPERSDREAAIVLEGRSLAAALELWRAQKDVRAALAALDQHDQRFAGGQMRVEARALRAEILLGARREADALDVLDRLPLDQVPRGRELRTLRGELRVRLGRCDEGRPDLESISEGTDALAIRARAALARCRVPLP